MVMDHQNQQTPTKLEYYDEMYKLQSTATLISTSLGEDGRLALILDSTIFYPQGGGQPYDTGFISHPCSLSNFIVQDVRSKKGIVLHYGVFEKSDSKLEEGTEVLLFVDESRRKINTRLHSAGHLLDICMKNVGLGHLEPGKSYHFPEGPYVEYIGAVPQSEWETKRQELELEANKLISEGGKVSVAILPYDKASEQCDGCLPDYIPKGSTPRIVKLGDYPGCPCGGTHVYDLSELISMKITQIRTKKGLTKVFYNVCHLNFLRLCLPTSMYVYFATLLDLENIYGA